LILTFLLLYTLLHSQAFIDAKILQPIAAAAGGGSSSGGKAAPKKKKKSKGTFAEGLAVLKNSPKIRNLALLVMSYGVGHRLFEFTWKGQLKMLYPTVQVYSSAKAHAVHTVCRRAMFRCVLRRPYSGNRGPDSWCCTVQTMLRGFQVRFFLYPELKGLCVFSNPHICQHSYSSSASRAR
jgi:hypothetical protein